MRRAPAVGEYVYVDGRTIGTIDRARGHDSLKRCALVRFVNGTAQYIDWEQLTHATDGHEAWRQAKAASKPAIPEGPVRPLCESCGKRHWAFYGCFDAEQH